jgi:5-oxoprolinase (ATP-hydrolysing)
MLGKLQPGFFPPSSARISDEPLDAEAPCARSSPRWPEIGETGKAPEEVAEGFLRIAVENMANAIKKISVQRGYDVTKYALNCFGGAGGQHACLVADALGMKTVSFTPSPACCRPMAWGLPTSARTRQLAVTLADRATAEIAASDRRL